MSDLISRQAAIDAVNAYMNLAEWKPSVKEILEMATNDIRSILESLPSAQPEIIHCEDCTHAQEDVLCGCHWCNGKAVTKHHYCGYAERKTNAT